MKLKHHLPALGIYSHLLLDEYILIRCSTFTTYNTNHTINIHLIYLQATFTLLLFLLYNFNSTSILNVLITYFFLSHNLFNINAQGLWRKINLKERFEASCIKKEESCCKKPSNNISFFHVFKSTYIVGINFFCCCYRWNILCTYKCIILKMTYIYLVMWEHKHKYYLTLKVEA